MECFYGNANRNRETAQRLIGSYDLFSQTVCLKQAMNKQTVFHHSHSSYTVHEDLTTCYYW